MDDFIELFNEYINGSAAFNRFEGLCSYVDGDDGTPRGQNADTKAAASANVVTVSDEDLFAGFWHVSKPIHDHPRSAQAKLIEVELVCFTSLKLAGRKVKTYEQFNNLVGYISRNRLSGNLSAFQGKHPSDSKHINHEVTSIKFLCLIFPGCETVTPEAVDAC